MRMLLREGGRAYLNMLVTLNPLDHLSADGVAFRGTFIIDEAGVVRSQIVNDLPIGRNIDETIRTVDALIFHEQHGEVCPAGWKDGDKGMDASPAGVAKYLAENADKL